MSYPKKQPIVSGVIGVFIGFPTEDSYFKEREGR